MSVLTEQQKDWLARLVVRYLLPRRVRRQVVVRAEMCRSVAIGWLKDVPSDEVDLEILRRHNLYKMRGHVDHAWLVRVAAELRDIEQRLERAQWGRI